MKEELTLAAEKRTVTGKQVKRLRETGVVPAVIYGHDMESTPVQVKHDDLVQVLRHGGRTAILRVALGGGEPFSAAIKQLHVHPITGRLLHADFYRVESNERLKMRVPIHLEGDAPALKTHEATLVRPVNDIQVECLPADLPAHVTVDLTKLTDLGSNIRVGDLQVPPGVTFLDPPDEVVVSVAAAAREAEVAEKAAETAEGPESGGAAPGESTGEGGGQS